jgi:hypothetical protein
MVAVAVAVGVESWWRMWSDCAWVIQVGAGGSKIKKRKSIVYPFDQVPPM